MAFEHVGHPYFRTEWGANTVGMIVEEQTDWDEVAELVIDCYCLTATRHLSDAIKWPDRTAVSGTGLAPTTLLVNESTLVSPCHTTCTSNTEHVWIEDRST